MLELQDPIEDDEQAAQFAMSNDIGVVMSASTLRNLLTMPWVNRDVNFATKVSVRRELMDGEHFAHLSARLSTLLQGASARTWFFRSPSSPRPSAIPRCAANSKSGR